MQANALSVETGLTNRLLEDIPHFQKHQFILQAERFIQAGTNPVMYYDAVRKSLPMVPGVEHAIALRLLTTIELALINTAAEELAKANGERKDGNTKATKPRELYVKYAPSLEAIIERGKLDPMQVYRKVRDAAPEEKRASIMPPVHKEPIWTTTAVQAKSVLHELYCSTSLSEGDLTNPDWIDPYTKETEIQANDASDYFDQLVQHDTNVSPIGAFFKMIEWDTQHKATDTPVVAPMSAWEKEVRQIAESCRETLKWTAQQVQQFIQAQLGGYDAESDDIVPPDDPTDPYTPPTLLPNELVLNKELWWSARDAVNAFHRARGAIFARMQEKGVKPRDWHATFRSLLVKDLGYKELLATIEKVASEDIVTAAAIYLSLAADYGLLPEDVQGIHGLQVNSAEQVKVGLLEFANAWEDDLLNLTQDALSPTSETSPHSFPDPFLDSIVQDNDGKLWIVMDAPVRKYMPHLHPNPVRTAAYNIGYTLAAMAGATFPQAEAAGMKMWREEMDSNAAKAYDRVFAETKSPRAAMAAFWKACDPIVPRPQEKVTGILPNKSGLRLASGREINWGLVTLKIRRNEIDFTDDDGNDRRARLLAKLQELNIGKPAWDLLKT
jgi:hypothetical protein